jgi:hypothetical protein
MHRHGGLLVLLFGSFAWSGCGADAGDACTAAIAHVNACAGTSLAAPVRCDADSAGALLALDCAALAPAAHAATDARPTSLRSRADDLLSAIACQAGIIRACPATHCDAQPPAEASCGGYIDVAGCGGCQFYACRDAEHGCGAHGYYLGYAQKYCERFLLALRPRMSPAGQRFLDAGRDCLMRYVDQSLPVDDACENVKTDALASHVACYRDNGFCALSLADKWLLLNTVEPADLDLVEALRTGLSCF